MIATALLLFTLATVTGLVFLVRSIQGEKTSLALMLGHAASSVAGLALVLVPFLQGRFDGPTGDLARFATFVLVAAALAGVVVFGLRLRSGGVPTAGAVAHGLAGVAGLLLLLLWSVTS